MTKFVIVKWQSRKCYTQKGDMIFPFWVSRISRNETINCTFHNGKKCTSPLDVIRKKFAYYETFRKLQYLVFYVKKHLKKKSYQKKIISKRELVNESLFLE